jgi:hypothetical protein
LVEASSHGSLGFFVFPTTAVFQSRCGIFLLGDGVGLRCLLLALAFGGVALTFGDVLTFAFAVLTSASLPSCALSVDDGAGVVVCAKRLTAMTGRVE